MVQGANLRVVQGENIGSVIALDGGDCSVGRGQGNTFQHPDPQMSRSHFRLFFRDTGWLIADLQSSNGTYVNGAAASSPVQLRSGDQIQAGNSVFVFEDLSASVASGANDQTIMGQQQVAVGQQPVPTQVVPQQQAHQPVSIQPVHPGQQVPEQQMPHHSGQYGQPHSYPPDNSVIVTGKGNTNWMWIVLALVALGPCGLFILGFMAIAVMPFVMVVGGLALGIIGLSNYNRFRGHPGWESQTTKGLVFCVGGFAMAALGLLWIIAAWFIPPA